MNSTLKSMLIAAAAITSVSAFAQDKATLDLLVKKGLITAEERAKTLDEAAKARSASGVNKVFVKEDATKRLTIGGYFQAQYQNFDYSQTTATGVSASAPTQGSFLMRRLYLELLAEIGAEHAARRAVHPLDAPRTDGDDTDQHRVEDRPRAIGLQRDRVLGAVPRIDVDERRDDAVGRVFADQDDSQPRLAAGGGRPPVARRGLCRS